MFHIPFLWSRMLFNNKVIFKHHLQLSNDSQNTCEIFTYSKLVALGSVYIHLSPPMFVKPNLNKH